MNKKPLVRYFYDGEWQDATVKDIGELENLATSVKTDLVSAINSLLDSSGSGVNDDVQKVIDDLNSNLNNLEKNINDVKISIGTTGLNEFQKIEVEQNIKDINKQIESNISAINDHISEIRNQIDTKISEVKSDYNNRVNEVGRDLEEAKSTLDKTNITLSEVRKSLSNIDLNVLEITNSIDEVKGEISQKVSKTDFDLTEAEVRKQQSQIQQNAEKIALSASKEELNLATDRVGKVEAELVVQADEIKSKVTSDEVRGEIEKIDKYQPNLLRNTRDWKDWTNEDTSSVVVTSNTYRMCHILEYHSNDKGLSKEVENLEIGKTYTVSVYAQANVGSELWLSAGREYRMTGSDNDSHMSDNWKRFRVSFVADEENMIIKFFFKFLTKVGKLSGAKLELGSKTSGWQPNADDIYEQTIHNETLIQQNTTGIKQTVDSIKKQGEVLEQHKSEIEQQANQIKLQVKTLTDLEDVTSENSASIKLLDTEIRSKVSSTEVGDMISDVSIDNRNRILNSDYGKGTDKWVVSKDFSVVEINGSKFLHASRTGVINDLVITAQSNPFSIKQGERIMFGFDFFAESSKFPDRDTVARFEILDINDVRVDFKEISLRNNYENNNKVQRLNDSYVVTRNDAVKARISFNLIRNGSVYFSKAMAQAGDIKSTEWSLAPEDIEIRRIEMESEILQTKEQISLKVSQADMDSLTEKVNSNTSEIDLTKKSIDLKVTETRDYVDKNAKDTLDQAKAYSNSQIQIETGKITQRVTSVESTLEESIKSVSDKVENIELQHGEDSYSVQIISTQGSVFRNGIGSTKLYAFVYKGADDVTDILNAACFIWKRSSDDAVSDTKWNDRNAGGSKIVNVTSEDVHMRATFSCSIDIELAEQILNK
ncbi:carbohydrate binding domain-containing protein [Enterococcus mundtii]|uniref:carbohydrate binding domain-containing protein n=1 Tax=Enterococcus mundtii TaxID=53346 RepID=UPI001A956DEF|nr:carbohydrate binding domain-containing protein [Enterococcus mundtii]MBO1087245.1 hypothetical protein [Enterococcus mundtii]